MLIHQRKTETPPNLLLLSNFLYIGKGYGPFLLNVFSLPLLVAHPLAELYIPHPEDVIHGNLNMLTWVGILMMMYASFWHAGLTERVISMIARRINLCSPSLNVQGGRGYSKVSSSSHGPHTGDVELNIRKDDHNQNHNHDSQSTECAT